MTMLSHHPSPAPAVASTTLPIPISSQDSGRGLTDGASLGSSALGSLGFAGPAPVPFGALGVAARACAPSTEEAAGCCASAVVSAFACTAVRPVGPPASSTSLL